MSKKSLGAELMKPNLIITSSLKVFLISAIKTFPIPEI